MSEYKLHKWDKRFLDLAKHVSTWSKDPSTQAGAVIVTSDCRVVSTGYNGFPKHMSDDPALYANREEKYSRVIHCEMNALLHAKESVEDCWLYLYPFMSCDRCMVHMIQAGINRIVAPKADAEREERWKDSFMRTRQYAKECGVRLWEV